MYVCVCVCVCIYIYIYIYIYVYISAVKRLIAINHIHNKRFCFHNICVYCVYLLCVYKYKHMHVIYNIIYNIKYKNMNI